MPKNIVSRFERPDKVESLGGSDPGLDRRSVFVESGESRAHTSGIPAAVSQDIDAGLWMSIWTEEAKYSA